MFWPIFSILSFSKNFFKVSINRFFPSESFGIKTKYPVSYFQLKEIPINSNQTYFDTNVTDHHHFFDIKEEKLIDLKNEDVGPIEIQKSIPGKKIKSVEVLVKLED